MAQAVEQPQVVTPENVPALWKNVPFRFLQYALRFGLIKWGYTEKEYIQYAIENQGYETVLVWGVQGSGKSNRILQEGYWVFEDWDKVLGAIVSKPKEFVERLQKIPFGERTPWTGWDDVGVHFPSVSWRTNIEQYEAVDAAWAAIRTKCNVISLNIPLIDRLARNLKDNLTMEVFLGRNQMSMIERYVRLPGIKRLESSFRKIQIEPMRQFNLFDVPLDVFKEYWQRRLELTEEALDKLGNVLTKTELQDKDKENYISLNEAMAELDISPRTLTDIIRNYRTQKFGGLTHIHREDYEASIKPYYATKEKES